MTNINKVSKSDLIAKTAVELKKVSEISPPEWAAFVKTGTSKQRPPMEEDWWYTRTASVMSKIQTLGPVGVSKLRTKYGSKKNRGHKPEEFRKASGNILRKILQQLETAGLARQTEKGVHKGRILTPKGISMMDTAAAKIISEPKPVKKAAVKEAKAEPKEPKQEAPKAKDAPADKTAQAQKAQPQKPTKKTEE